MHGEKESARSRINDAKQQAKAQAKPKAAAPAIVRKVRVAMPPIAVKRAATSEAKKGDKRAEESEAEVETVYHDRDAEDAVSMVRQD